MRHPFCFLLIPLIILFMFGCDMGSEGRKRISVEEGKELPFPLSEKTYKARNPELISLNGEKFLLNNNFSIYDTVNELELYSFEDRRLVRRIDLLPDTKDFTRIHDLIYLDHDSIFFTRPDARAPYKTHFLRMDSVGKVLEKWTFNGKPPGTSARIDIGGGRVFNPLTHRKGAFYSAVYPKRKDIEGSVFAHPHTARISLKEDSGPKVRLFGRYPKIYEKVDKGAVPEKSLQTIKPFGIFDHAFQNGSIVFAYPFSDTLYRYDLQGDPLGKKAVKSRYADPEKVWDLMKTSGMEGLSEAFPDGPRAYPHYFTLSYDPSRELFYRTVNIDAEDASIMVLDDELNFLKELRVRKKPGPHMMPFHGKPIPVEEGLYIPRKDKDEFRFRVIGIEKSE